jgi:hypothetical protein
MQTRYYEANLSNEICSSFISLTHLRFSVHGTHIPVNDEIPPFVEMQAVKCLHHFRKPNGHTAASPAEVPNN